MDSSKVYRVQLIFPKCIECNGYYEYSRHLFSVYWLIRVANIRTAGLYFNKGIAHIYAVYCWRLAVPPPLPCCSFFCFTYAPQDCVRDLFVQQRAREIRGKTTFSIAPLLFLRSSDIHSSLNFEFPGRPVRYIFFFYSLRYISLVN